MRRGQAMLETVLAVIFITTIFLTLFSFSRKLTSKTVLDYAAARAARAKAVGFNDYMCLKTAHVAAIPVSGRMVWPQGINDIDERARVPLYLAAEYEGVARGILEYEYWKSAAINVKVDKGAMPLVSSDIVLENEEFRMKGESSIEAHYPLYMNEDRGGGL